MVSEQIHILQLLEALIEVIVSTHSC
jgi:hypothetical protein